MQGVLVQPKGERQNVYELPPSLRTAYVAIDLLADAPHLHV